MTREDSRRLMAAGQGHLHLEWHRFSCLSSRRFTSMYTRWTCQRYRRMKKRLLLGCTACLLAKRSTWSHAYKILLESVLSESVLSESVLSESVLSEPLLTNNLYSSAGMGRWSSRGWDVPCARGPGFNSQSECRCSEGHSATIPPVSNKQSLEPYSQYGRGRGTPQPGVRGGTP